MSAADLAAYLDAIAAQTAAEHAATTARIAGQLAADLRALGIDSAELRANAVREYLLRLEAAAERRLNRAIVAVIAVGFITDNARLRNTRRWMTIRDVYEAIARVRVLYGEKAADHVRQVFVPPDMVRDAAVRG